MAKKKRKPGRPEKPPEKRMEKSVHIKIDEKRKAIYEQAAEASGFDSLSAWVRRLMDDAVAKLKPTE